jgi:hypothetical protein
VTHSRALRAAHTQAATVSEADLGVLAKKRKLIEQQCVVAVVVFPSEV